MPQNGSFVLSKESWNKRFEKISDKASKLLNYLSDFQAQIKKNCITFSQKSKFFEFYRDFNEGGIFEDEQLVRIRYKPDEVILDFDKQLRVYTPSIKARRQLCEIIRMADDILKTAPASFSSERPSTENSQRPRVERKRKVLNNFENSQSSPSSFHSSPISQQENRSLAVQKRNKISCKSQKSPEEQDKVSRALEVLNSMDPNGEIEYDAPEILEICEKDFIHELIRLLSQPPAKLQALSAILNHDVYCENQDADSNVIAYEIFKKICDAKDWNLLEAFVNDEELLKFAEKDHLSFLMKKAGQMEMPENLRDKINLKISARAKKIEEFLFSENHS